MHHPYYPWPPQYGQPGHPPHYDPWHAHGGYHPHPAWHPHPHDEHDSFANPKFVRGMVTGAVLTYLLTNENVQDATIKSLVKVWSKLQGGIEEVKERFRDAEAELKAEEVEDM